MKFGMDYSVPGVLGGLGQGYSQSELMYFGKIFEPNKDNSIDSIERIKNTIGNLLYGLLYTTTGIKNNEMEIKTLKGAVRHFIDVPANLLVLAELLGVEISNIVGKDLTKIYINIINKLEEKLKKVTKKS